MALFFAPVANIVLSAVRPEEEGKASGANNAIRELGGVFGVAVLASVFAHAGGYRTADDVRRRDDGRPCTSAPRSSALGAWRRSRSRARRQARQRRRPLGAERRLDRPTRRAGRAGRVAGGPAGRAA